jgi:hypothetical protein
MCWTSFTSTSTIKGNTLKCFGAGGTLMKLDVIDGRDISGLSLFQDEMEVLLPPNSTFKVTVALSSEQV